METQVLISRDAVDRSRLRDVGRSDVGGPWQSGLAEGFLPLRGLAPIASCGQRSKRTWVADGRGAFASSGWSELLSCVGPSRHTLLRCDRTGGASSIARRAALSASWVGRSMSTTVRGEPGAYEDFMRLEAEGWKGRDGTALASNPGHASFFRTVCGSYARSGRLQLLDLSAAGSTVAMKCNLLAGDVVFCFKIAYDERYATYSPGLQLERRTIDTFHARTSAIAMDSSQTRHNDMINRLWPDRRSLATMLLPSEGALGWVSARSARAAVAVHRRVERLR